MVNFHKPLREMTDDELTHGVQHWPMEMISSAVLEMQRRQQEKYFEQDAARMRKLSSAVVTLKEISELNAQTAEKSSKASDRLAKIALGIAVLSLLAQVIFR